MASVPVGTFSPGLAAGAIYLPHGQQETAVPGQRAPATWLSQLPEVERLLFKAKTHILGVAKLPHTA